jgi:hypothetical protein
MQWQTIEEAKAKDKIERIGCQQPDRNVSAQTADLESRIRKARESLRRSQNYVDAMKTRIIALTADLANQIDPVQRAAVERDRQKALVELGLLRQDAADDSRRVSDIEREAVRAGIALRRH